MSTERLHWRNDIDYLEKRLAAEQAEVTRLKAALEEERSQSARLCNQCAAMREALQYIYDNPEYAQPWADGILKTTSAGADLLAQLTEAKELLTRSQGINVTNGPLWRNQRDAFLARHTP